jgi:hypothetical protein
MSTDPEPAAAEPSSFSTDSLKEAATLCCHGHNKGIVFVDPRTLAQAQPKCLFVFPDSPKLQEDVERIRAKNASVEPGFFMRTTKQLRQAMDRAIGEARAEASPETLQLLEWEEHEAERRRIAATPTAWTRLRAQQAAQEGAALRRTIDRRGEVNANRPWSWERVSPLQKPAGKPATKPAADNLRDGDISGSNQLFFGGKD